MAIHTDVKTNLNKVLQSSTDAFLSYKNASGRTKAMLLREIAANIEKLGTQLISTACQETSLPEARISGERDRTLLQLIKFAEALEEGSWVDASIETALPDRKPLPKADIRKILVPIGPVVVFGASNFPLAFSTAGGDTASALAAGCPVVFRAHYAHPQTSVLVANAIKEAIKKCGLPEGIFLHIHENGNEIGEQLVLHPMTKAVGFTGSFEGGKYLYDLTQTRKEPIPFFAEMGSTNPVFLFPDALKTNTERITQLLVSSVTASAGQFCTKPGIIIAEESEALESFLKGTCDAIEFSDPQRMLHEGILFNFMKKKERALAQPGVKQVTKTTDTYPFASPVIASVSAKRFLEESILQHEVFGPFALVVKCSDASEFLKVAALLEGQLTVTLMATEKDLNENSSLINILKEKCGRIIINGVPTGVEVCGAMQHGGPFPAASDSRFTSVGTDAMKRFVRPLCFQSYPENLLPAELQDENPLAIWRKLNGRLTKDVARIHASSRPYSFYCVDAHTCGNPVRVVISGGPELNGDTMSEKRLHFMKEFDWIRKSLMFEPRGHDMMSGSILYPPCDPANDVGILFIETSGCLPMCGHGTIGTVTVAIEQGAVKPKTPGVLLIEVPAGKIKAEYVLENNKVKSVKITNIKSYFEAEGLLVDCPELGELSVDVAYGGNFYGIIDPQKNFPGLEHFKAEQLIKWSRSIREALNKKSFVHPENPAIKGLSHILWTGAPINSDSTARNAVFYGDKAIDRSPCGTGTSARMAQWFAKGELQPGDEFVHESIIGSKFIGRIEEVTELNGKPAIIPSIEGWARVYGMNHILVDKEDDPFAEGFQVI